MAVPTPVAIPIPLPTVGSSEAGSGGNRERRPVPKAIAAPRTAAAQTLVAASALPGGALLVAGQTWAPVVKPLSLGGPATLIPLADGKVLGRVLVHAAGLPKDLRAAALVLVDAKGAVLLRTELGVPLPSTFYWEPGSGTALEPGSYGLALEVLTNQAQSAGESLVGWRSAPVRLELAERGLGLVPAGDPDKVVRATLFDAGNQPTDSMKDWLSKTGSSLKGQPGQIAVVTVHDHGAGDAAGRSALQAQAVRNQLVAAGAQSDRLVVFGVGSEVADFKPNLASMGPHRVEVRMRPLETGSAKGEAPAFAVAEGLWVDGKRVADRVDAIPGQVSVHAGEPSLIVQQRPDGQAAVWQRTFAVQAPGAAQGGTPQQVGSGALDFAGDLLDDLGNQTRAAEAAAQGLPAPKATEVAPRTRGLDCAAADLQLWLPKAGLPLATPDLALRGRTRPGNKITIQGQAIPVDAEGRFFAQIRLPAGKSTLSVVSTDPAGNKAMLERELTVQDRQFFLLAIADGSISQVGAHLIEAQNDPNAAAVVGDSAQLYGRVAAYAKGRISGQFLGLKDLQFTAHVDTAKNPLLQDFASNLLDPTRFYPVYGDASTAVQDVNSRGKLYVLVEADRFKAMFGNFRSGIKGIELVRYERALYGAEIDVRRTLGQGFDTRVHGFVASQDQNSQRHTDVLRGTGGSIYYLSGRDLVDGSEHVDIVVRDRISNLEIARITQARNTDYTIDPAQGRVLFKSPVASAVDGAFIAAQTGLPGQNLTWNGQPVFVEAVYEARTVQSKDGVAFGAELQEKMLNGKLSIGGHYAQEGRGTDPSYRLAGGDVAIQFAKGTKLTAEYAYSQSRDSMLAVSDDGGLTYGTPKYATDTLSGGKPVTGQAVKVAFDADLRDMFGKSVGVELPQGQTATTSQDKGALDKVAAQNPLLAKDIGRLRASYQWVQAGFQSGGAIAQQGQQKVGVDTAFVLGAGNTLQLRYDGLLSGQQNPALYGGSSTASQWGTGTFAGSGALSAWNRHLITVQDVYKSTARWSILGGNTYSFGTGQDGSSVSGDTVMLGGQYRATERWTLRGDQQVIVLGDPSQFRSDKGALDHLATTFGADYKLSKSLSLTAQERVGWGGQNATLAGLRTSLDETTSAYVQQKLEDSYQTGKPVSATVVGAESRYGTDKSARAYGEYQIDNSSSAGMNRAVMGVGKKFEVQKGVTVDGGYERSQTFGGATGVTSRDAFSVGGEWLKHDWWKLTSRQEVRVDQGDPSVGGSRKLQWLSMNNMQAGITKELTLFVRANWTRTENETLSRTEAEALEATLGVSFRPIRHNWLNVIGKVTHLIEQRPSAQDPNSTERSAKDILGLEPVAELPLRLQFAQKVAWKHDTESLPGLAAATSDLVLLISRLSWHAMAQVDLAAEYRFLDTVLAKDVEHGALFEAAWVLKKTLRLGAGYNFSHFVETMVGDIQKSTSPGGFFLRMTGMY